MQGSKTSHRCLRGLFAALVGAALVLSPSVADAQVYRWVDENGRVYFSDRPPTGRSSEEVPIRNRPTQLEATLRDDLHRQDERQARDEDRADEVEQAAAKREHAAATARACEQAGERVTRIESARRLSRVNEDGSRHTYTDAERAAALAEARRQVAEWCR